MSKFVFIADLHLSKYSQDKIMVESGLPEKLHHIKNVLSEIIDYCKLNNIKNIKIGGDLFHTKSIIHAIAQKVLLDFFRDNQDIHFDVIDGNHDLSGKGNDVVSALESLENEPNITRYSKATLIDNIFYVPYSDDMVEIIKNNSAKYLISHFGLNEGILNSGISIVSDIGLNDLRNKYQYVLIGHYHKPQEIIREDIQVWIPGSIIQLDWGEKHEEKRFLVVDLENDKIEPIEIKNYKKHFVLELTSENKDETIKLARELINEGHLVNLKKTEDFNIKDISTEFKIIDKVEVDITNRGIDTSMSDIDRMKKYLEIKKIPQNEWDTYLQSISQIISNQNQ